MTKKLENMTLEELWILFPIILKPHNSDYFNWYKEEADKLLALVNTGVIKRLNHMGSSCIEGLISKPTVDILVEIESKDDIEMIMNYLIELGWGIMSRDDDLVNISLCKGYTPEGFADRVFHLHIRMYGECNQLYFRDYLREHEGIKQAYGDLKLSLEEDYKNDRDGYTEAKSEFIVKYTNIAKKYYKNKYN